jgi:hypothetical protein
MNAKQLLTVSIIAGALAAAAIASQAQTVTRADVNASVLAARARGELIPAGEAIQPFALRSTGAGRARKDVRNEVLSARADGALVPAGEGMTTDAPTVSLLARADVRESVREARLNGELIPAGEGMRPADRQARAHRARGAFAFRMHR